MEYREFAEMMVAKLNQKMGENVEVTLESSVKNNGTVRIGAMFRKNGTPTGAVLYFEDVYKWFGTGKTMDMLVDVMLSQYRDAEENIPTEFLPKLLDFERVKNKIVLNLVSTGLNKSLFTRIPSVGWLDLTLVFRVMLEADERGMSSVLVSNDLMTLWNQTPESLLKVAEENTMKLLPIRLMNMSECFQGFPVAETEQDMYVLSNASGWFGAAALFCAETRKMLRDYFHEDLLLIPSSVHEWLILPKSRSAFLDMEMMTRMIQEVNHTQLAPEDILAEHGYVYDFAEDKISA